MTAHTKAEDMAKKRLGAMLAPFSLTFKGEQADWEAPFRRAYFKSTLGQARVAIGFGILYFSLFAILDLLVIPNRLLEAWLCRFGVFLPAGLVVLALSYHKSFMHYFQASLAFLVILGGLGVIYLTTLTTAQDAYLYYAGLILAFMFGYGFARLRFVVATCCGWLLVLAFLVVELGVNHPSLKGLVANQFFFVGANIVGMMICYHQEKAARLAFLLQNQLSDQNALLLSHNENLAKLSNLDGLTKVANRRHFDHFMFQSWRQCQAGHQPIAVIICDIDVFKQYNDHYGHLAGDDCLVKVAKALARTVRRQGSLVARYGGEEFAVVLTGVYMEESMRIAERIRQQVEDLALPHCLSAQGVVTLSLGVAAVIPDNSLSQRELFQCADSALYEAKLAGRNQVKAGKLFTSQVRA
ncbi:diguanylate cyclase [Gallaecimonas xiamenensis]|nr:diguanylate cyclase [Gallaecimonas xiamenensis]